MLSFQQAFPQNIWQTPLTVWLAGKDIILWSLDKDCWDTEFGVLDDQARGDGMS